MDERVSEVGRRTFLRRAAVGAAVLWTTPIVQSIPATRAYAHHVGTPPPGKRRRRRRRKKPHKPR